MTNAKDRARDRVSRMDIMSEKQMRGESDTSSLSVLTSASAPLPREPAVSSSPAWITDSREAKYCVIAGAAAACRAIIR